MHPTVESLLVEYERLVASGNVQRYEHYVVSCSGMEGAAGVPRRCYRLEVTEQARLSVKVVYNWPMTDRTLRPTIL
jgi:hypothetical protein